MARPQSMQLPHFAMGEVTPGSSYQDYGQRMAAHNGQQEEMGRFNNMLENEAKERRKAELKILELTAQLEDARRGLRETQNALLDVQHAAEVDH